MTSGSDVNSEGVVEGAAVAPVAVAKKTPATPVVPAERVKRKQTAKSKVEAEDAFASDAVHNVATDAIRSVAEHSLDQVRSAFARSHEASLSFAKGFEASGQVVQSGLKEIQTRVADAFEAEAHAAFGYFRAMTQVKTLSEIIDLQASQLRKQFERNLDEARDLSSLATAVATKASEPVRKAFSHALEAQRPSH